QRRDLAAPTRGNVQRPDLERVEGTGALVGEGDRPAVGAPVQVGEHVDGDAGTTGRRRRVHEGDVVLDVARGTEAPKSAAVRAHVVEARLDRRRRGQPDRREGQVRVHLEDDRVAPRTNGES